MNAPGAVLDLLIDVRERIEDPDHWTTGTLARDDQGRSCDVDDPDAKSFCLIGAMWKAKPEYRGLTVMDLIEALEDQSGALMLVEVNNRLGHQAVLDLLDRGIDAARRAYFPS